MENGLNISVGEKPVNGSALVSECFLRFSFGGKQKLTNNVPTDTVHEPAIHEVREEERL